MPSNNNNSKASRILPVVDGEAGSPVDLHDRRIQLGQNPPAGDMLVTYYNQDAGEWQLVPETPPAIRTICGEQLADESLGDINIHDGYYFPNAVQDYDGNWYGAVVIGGQVWLAENLRTTHYSEGNPIQEYTGYYNGQDDPKYYQGVNNDIPLEKRGLLYTWSAATNSAEPSNDNPSGIQGISPDGWHIPSLSEYQQLKGYISNQKRYRYFADIPNSTLKSLCCVENWDQYDDDDDNPAEGTPGTNNGLNNATGFSAVPFGQGESVATFESFTATGKRSNFWLASGDSYNRKYYALLRYDLTLPGEGLINGGYLYSVRCVCDLSPIQFRDWYLRTYGTLQHHLDNGGEPNVQADWSQTDSAAADFIKNKPFQAVDAALSGTSENPVQNRAIYALTRQLWNRVDVVARLGDEYAATNNYIAPTGANAGNWASSSTYRHWLVPVDGMRMVTIEANETTDSWFAFLTSEDSTATAGATPSYADGYTGIYRVPFGETRVLPVPSDAEYLYLNTGNTGTDSAGPARPAHVWLTGVAVNEPPCQYVYIDNAGRTNPVAVTDTHQRVFVENQSSNTASLAFENADSFSQEPSVPSGSRYLLDITIVNVGSGQTYGVVNVETQFA